MDLTCSLSPLVYAELYSLLGARTAWADALEERLEEGGLEHEWLEEAADLYRTYWLSVAEYEPMLVLDAEHAHLASWLLAGLLRKGESSEFSADLQRRIRNRYHEDLGSEIGILPDALAVTIVSWTLGKVIGEYDIEYPVVPAVLPADDDVAMAYHGLVEHVAALPKQAPWPEMLGSATHWRGAGLAESLQPVDPPNLSTSIGHLVRLARPHMAEHRHAKLEQHWNRSDFVARRKVLTHVRSDGGVAFAAASKLASDHQGIQPTLAGVTQFVFQRICEELGDPGNRPPWGAKWEVLQHDITVW